MRKVKIKSLNDSKYAAGQMYVISIALLILICLTFFLDGYPNIGEAIISGAILTAGTAFIALAFVPKVRSHQLYHSSTSVQNINLKSPFVGTQP